MGDIVLLLSRPGGAEWLIVLLYGFFVLLFPILAIVFYFQVQKLKKENKELRDKLSR